MRNISIRPYPELTDDLLNSVDCSFSHGPIYLDDNGNDLFDEDGHIIGAWDPDKDPFVMSFTLSIKNPSELFGADGVASPSSVLAVFVEWNSRGSHLKGYSEDVLEIVSDKNDSVSKMFRLVIPPGSIRDSARFRLVLCLKEYRENSKTHSIYASEPGMRLGEFFDWWTVVIDGTSSSFPVVYKHLGNSKPLWKMEYDGHEPTLDRFSEDMVRLVINADHKAFPTVRSDMDGLSDGALLNSVLSSCLLEFFVYVYSRCGDSEWEEIIQGKDLSPESVGMVIRYWCQELEIDELYNTGELGYQLREMVEARLSKEV